MFGRLRLNRLCKVMFLVVPILALNLLACAPTAKTAAKPAAAEKPKPKIDVFQVLVVNEDGSDKGVEKAYTFAGVIIDRARRVKRNVTDAEVKVRGKMPAGKNSGKSYDVVFLVRPAAISSGKILTLTSGPVGGCRAFVKTFLTKTLSSKRIAKAYKGAGLATVDKDPTAKSLAQELKKGGWLSKC
jgi:hypothetical protein